MKNPFTARWTATGTNLCLGEWDIRYQGRPLELDAERRDADMGTFGIYSFLYPDDEDYAEGLDEDAWIAEHGPWLRALLTTQDIPADEAHLRAFYRAVSAADWRCGSCGGCI